MLCLLVLELKENITGQQDNFEHYFQHLMSLTECFWITATLAHPYNIIDVLLCIVNAPKIKNCMITCSIGSVTVALLYGTIFLRK